MTEGVAAATASEDAQHAARLRKERREAKIKAGGSARLSKITGMGGCVTGDASDPTASSPPSSVPPPRRTTEETTAATAAQKQQQHDDPEEVDISQHDLGSHRTAAGRHNATFAPRPGGLSEAQLRQMMLGLEPSPAAAAGATPPRFPSPASFPGLAGDAAGGSSFSSFSPAPSAPPDRSTAVWRVLHGLVALGLGLYVAALTPFTGTRLQRERDALGASTGNAAVSDDVAHHKVIFFWVFVTAEALLLSTYFILQGKGVGVVAGTGAGILSTVVSFLPEPWHGYVLVALRYGHIFKTVRMDLLVCMFVLGVCSWWKS